MSISDYIGGSPRLFITLFRRRINSFHFFGGMGLSVGLILGLAVARMEGLPLWPVIMMTLIGSAVFIGLAWLARWITGREMIVYYHHEIAILLCCAGGLYACRAPVLPYLDICLLGIGTFLAFGRIGCHSVGCCHGRPCVNGVCYGRQHVEAGFTWYYKDVPLLPVQLMEAAFVALIVIAGMILIISRVPSGTFLLVYTVIYGTIRYGLEFFRGDPDRPQWKGLSEAQWTTLILLVLTLGLGVLGWLPRYTWHFVALILLSSLSLTVMIIHRIRPDQQLFAPGHIMQLAEGLRFLQSDAAKGKDGPVVFTTPKGLHISSGACGAGKRHYTVSHRSPGLLKQKSAEKLAKWLASSGWFRGGFEIVQRRDGIFHILFNESRDNQN